MMSKCFFGVRLEAFLCRGLEQELKRYQDPLKENHREFVLPISKYNSLVS